MQLQCPFLLQVLSVWSCYGMPYLMFHVHSHKLDKMTGAWLLPVVSAAERKPEHTGLVCCPRQAWQRLGTHKLSIAPAHVQQPAQHKSQHCQGTVCGLYSDKSSHYLCCRSPQWWLQLQVLC